MRDFKLTWLDRFFLNVAPGWAMRRVRARAHAQIMASGFDAVAGGRRTSGWQRQSGDANTANHGALNKLREIARDLRRNNGWAKRAIEVISNNTVGWGIGVRATGPSKEVNARAMALWKEWSESPACDFDGRLPFTGQQGMVMETVPESGECLAVFEPANSRDGLPLSAPWRLRLLEPDHLDTEKDGIAADGGNPIVQGVELDGRGRRVAYWIFDTHPGAVSGSLSRVSTRFVSRRVPADRVLHVYGVTRPGQIRGYSWIAAVIALLQDLGDYADARLMQQKVAACFGAFVHDIDGDPTATGEQDPNDQLLETLEPGHISYLGPGQTITFASPPPTAGHDTFTREQLSAFAAGVGITYEELTGDYSRSNFSSNRMSRIAHWQNVHKWRWRMLIPQFCQPTWVKIMTTAAAIEGWPYVPGAEWAPPPMPMLEPEKEGLAYQRLMRAGVMTLAQVIREQGEDPDTHLEEIAEFNGRLDDMGIWLDSDPRRTSAAGLTQNRQRNELGEDG